MAKKEKQVTHNSQLRDRRKYIHLDWCVLTERMYTYIHTHIQIHIHIHTYADHSSQLDVVWTFAVSLGHHVDEGSHDAISTTDTAECAFTGRIHLTQPHWVSLGFILLYDRMLLLPMTLFHSMSHERQQQSLLSFLLLFPFSFFTTVILVTVQQFH